MKLGSNRKRDRSSGKLFTTEEPSSPRDLQPLALGALAAAFLFAPARGAVRNSVTAESLPGEMAKARQDVHAVIRGWVEIAKILGLYEPERKRIEGELRTSELRFRSLFEQTHDAVFILDLEGNHLAANQRAADMLGKDL